ncbi:hypothetical protein PanWU01x14_278350 [Parasponia andersonii]|uniref:Uncharacterized protein n=1 Tax=Parasponia andersonii TaxID=3476 RepID=A0A2P5B2E5_PARAD|nr:hypothetical protein PanWU01x14_278350 [Parasponia andersonii]
MEITRNQYVIPDSAINIGESDTEDNPRNKNLSILHVHGEALLGAKSLINRNSAHVAAKCKEKISDERVGDFVMVLREESLALGKIFKENLKEKMKRASMSRKGPHGSEEYRSRILCPSKARLALGSKYKILEDLEMIDGVGNKLKGYMKEVNPEILEESAMQACQEQYAAFVGMFRAWGTLKY